MVNQSQFIEKFGPSSNWPKEELYKNVEEMFIGPFGSSLKNDCFVEKEKGYCVVYEQKHAIEKSIELPFRYVTHDKYQELKRFEVLPGDIIVSCRGTVGEVYRIPDNAPRGIMHPSIMKIRLKKESFSSEYFVFAVAEYMKDRESKNLGTGVKMAVTATDMGKELFTKPSVTEQNSFISIIHHADKSKFAGFKSQFIEMFGDLSTNSTNINITTIDELFDVGSSKRVFEKDWTTSGVPFYRAREIVKLAKDGFVDNELFITESMYSEYAEKYGIPAPGDIMVTGVGTLGVCYLVKEGDRFYYKDGNTLCFHSLGKIDSRFVVECYKMPFVINQIEGRADFTTVGTYTIEKARKTRIPWPSKEQQKKFLSVVYQADKSKYLN